MKKSAGRRTKERVTKKIHRGIVSRKLSGPGPRIGAIFYISAYSPGKSLPYNRVIAVDEEPEEFLFEPDFPSDQCSAFIEVKSGELILGTCSYLKLHCSFFERPKNKRKKSPAGEIFAAFPAPPLKPLNSIRCEARISNSNGFFTFRLRSLVQQKFQRPGIKRRKLLIAKNGKQKNLLPEMTHQRIPNCSSLHAKSYFETWFNFKILYAGIHPGLG